MKKSIVFALALTLVFLLGCAQNNALPQNNTATISSSAQEVDSVPKVQKGDIVSVNYRGTLGDGTEFDSSLKEGREPLSFTVGAGQMIKGFDAAVLGMKQGEEKIITLKPSEAYGETREDLIQFVPKENFGELFDSLGIGEELKTTTGTQATVMEKTDDGAKLNFNHFLAGKTLTFWIKIESIEKP